MIGHFVIYSKVESSIWNLHEYSLGKYNSKVGANVCSATIGNSLFLIVKLFDWKKE